MWPSPLTSPQYDEIRVARGTRERAAARSARAARANPIRSTCRVPVPVPTFTGSRVMVEYPLEELVPLSTGAVLPDVGAVRDLSGDLEDAVVGEAARSLFADARALLDRIVRERILEARAAVGFLARNAAATISSCMPILAERGASPLHMLRQQLDKKGDGRPNSCLADLVAPRKAESSIM